MKAKPSNSQTSKYIIGLVANQAGEIFELDGFAAVGMANSALVPLTLKDTANLPYGSELMFLPQRHPILYNLETGQLQVMAENPYVPGEKIYPVAAFNSPGYITTFTSAYAESPNCDLLPLFSYGAVGWSKGRFRSAVIQVDWERRQDLRLMPDEDVRAGITRMRRRMPDNRLRAHLENCALQYGCPAGKNFFLARYEAPLPTSNRCNARCLGCLSLQLDDAVHISQERIAFTPTPDEIAEIALTHLKQVARGVVSFGQGCEGDPLLAAHVIEPAIRKIRSQTRRGTINLNTNASRPVILQTLMDAGLDSMRVSLNSVRKPCYEAYFRPQGYTFENVLASIDLAIAQKCWVSINYLNCPGFTDAPEEAEALTAFLQRYPINMIQWRNLNFDPMHYWQTMAQAAPVSPPLGMRSLLARVRKVFPALKHGYFNPPKEKWR